MSTRHQLLSSICTESRLDNYKNQASRKEEFHTAETQIEEYSKSTLFCSNYILKFSTEWMTKMIHVFICKVFSQFNPLWLRKVKIWSSRNIKLASRTWILKQGTIHSNALPVIAKWQCVTCAHSTYVVFLTTVLLINKKPEATNMMCLCLLQRILQSETQ